MKLTNHKGNIFDTKADVIGHGVNCKYAFGAGIAGQIREMYPEAYHFYMSKPDWKLGDAQFVPISYKMDANGYNYTTFFGKPYYIANLATQEGYGNGYANKKVFVDYDAICTSLNKLFDFVESDKTLRSVALPRIGCGLAGGDWHTVEHIIQQCIQDRNIELEIWEYK